MGAINKHPSCTLTWEEGVLASKHVSIAFGQMLQANAHLEDILLSEFHGRFAEDNVENMLSCVKTSQNSVVAMRDALMKMIDLAQESNDDYSDTRLSIDPVQLSQQWDGQLLFGCTDDVIRIGSDIKRERLSELRELVGESETLLNLTESAMRGFENAAKEARRSNLASALKENRISLQATFGTLLSYWLMFMRKYLVDAMVGAHIMIVAEGGKPLLAG